MNASSSSTTADDPVAARRDWLTILLVGVAHASSHFFQLVIPSLYVPLGREFGLDFAALGLLATVFFVASGIGQASSGFVVDRLGARPILWFGLSSFVVAALLMATAQHYAVLLVAAGIAGLGNSVFHPVDFAILNDRISQKRLGHAFSVHGLTGSLGWALTPVFIATLTALYDWRVAVFGVAALCAAVLLLTILGRHLLAGSEPVIRPAQSAQAGQAGRAASSPGQPAAAAVAAKAGETASAAAPAGVLATLAMLASRPALWAAFLFFGFTSLALSSVQNYTIPLLGSLYGVGDMAASSALSSYMVASAFGMMLGGFLVSSTPHTERIVAASLILAGGILALLATGAVPAWLAVPAVALAGFCSGTSGPSRDMLVRRVAPKGATGSVYGLVYSGMDVGAATGPLLFGLMMDAGLRQGPWLGGGAAFVVGALLAWQVARAAARSAKTA